MNNEFLVVIAAYNVEKYIALNIELLKKQTIKNFKCIIYNDASTDNTKNIIDNSIEDDDRFNQIISENRSGSPLSSIVNAINIANPADHTIIVIIDGDDWLSSPFTLEYLHSIYNREKCWLTYGTYQIYPTGVVSDHHTIDIPENIHNTNSYKKFPFVTSHLKTFKSFLYKKINNKDLIDYDTNEYYKTAGDVALMMPLLEMTPNEKIYKIQDITYILNRENELNEANSNLQLQKDTEQKIRNTQKIYKKIYNKISCDILGPGEPGKIFNYGLCNQMFQIATVLSTAHDTNQLAVFPQLQNTKFYGKYIDNIFSRLNINGDLKFIENYYNPTKFEYNKIPNKKNLMIKGYFQSEKYFKHNRELILKYFEPTSEVKKILNTNHGIIWDLAISLHVRRGDYINLPNHHPIQSIEYYKKALEYIKTELGHELFKYYSVVIFSDDIEWCKKNFNFIENRVIFITNNPDYIDLYMMSMCTHHIIANSSFSWWGAWLSKPNYPYSIKVDGITVAPKNWFGPARADLNTKDLYCKNWVII